MEKLMVWISKLLLAAACLAWLGSPPAYSEQQSIVGEIVGKFHGVSPALRSLPPPPLNAPRKVLRIKPLRHPHPVSPLNEPAVQDDPGLQTAAPSPVPAPIGLNILGLGAGFPNFTVEFVPPDTNAAVGTTQVVETVNLSLQVFNKTTGVCTPTAVCTPVDLSALVTTGDNCQNGEMSDPVVLFDKIHSRWVIAYVAGTAGGPLGVSAPFLQCFAVSKSDDATGAYNLYSFDVSTLGGLLTNPALNDGDKMGIWPDAYYLSYNEFDQKTQLFLGAGACAVDSSKMIAGQAAKIVCFFRPTEDSLRPADLDGSTLPPANEPAFYVGTLHPPSHFNLWQFHVDFANAGNSTFNGPAQLTVQRFAEACGGGVCIRQPKGGESLDSLGDQLMHRAAYRNFGTHESIVLSHSVRARKGSGIRWYELRSPVSSPFVFQQGTFAPDTNFRWTPSIAMDKAGDIAVGYSLSGRTLFPSIRYTGRTPDLPPGQMSSEASIVEGTGVQFGQMHRWGDYSSMSIDPVDDCTFWYAQEYITMIDAPAWSTQLANFKFPNCQ
jgi:hypothetical protein